MPEKHYSSLGVLAAKTALRGTGRKDLPDLLGYTVGNLELL